MIVSVPERWLSYEDITFPFNEELHIWFIDLDTISIDFNQEFKELSFEDQHRLSSIQNDFKKEISTKRHILLLKILSHYLQKSPSEIHLKYSEFGKPFIESTLIKFNVSNSYNYFLVGITSEIEIGVDVEKFRSNERFEKLVERYFTTKEKNFYNSLQEHKQEVFFFDLWTMKEAVVKAVGLGMRLQLNSFEFPLDENEDSTFIQQNSVEKKLFVLKCLVSNDTSISVCLEEKVSKIKYFKF